MVLHIFRAKKSSICLRYCKTIDYMWCFVGITGIVHAGTLQSSVVQQVQAIHPHQPGYAMPQAMSVTQIPHSPVPQSNADMNWGE